MARLLFDTRFLTDVELHALYTMYAMYITHRFV